MGRTPCCNKDGLKRGPWTSEEDLKLTQYIETHGPGNWRILPKSAGLQRCGKSCRLRWTNYLRPDIKRGRFSFEEEETIIQLHSLLGNKWSAIAARLPGRTDNEIKNYWNTHIRKRLLRMGLDPVTHTPKFDHLIGSSSSQLNILSNLLLALNQQQQQLANPQLLSIIATLLVLNQQSLPNQVLLSNNVSDQPGNHTNWQHSELEQLLSNSIGRTPSAHSYLPHNNAPPFVSQHHQFENMQPSNVAGEFSSGGMEDQGFDGMGADHQMILGLQNQPNIGSMSNNQHFSFKSVSSTPLTSSSSDTTNGLTNENEKDSYCTSLFNFEIPEEFDMSDLL